MVKQKQLRRAGPIAPPDLPRGAQNLSAPQVVQSREQFPTQILVAVFAGARCH